VVLDIGAHVGFFVRSALAQGASKVIAVEPDPNSVECLRRNFPEELEAGQLVIVEAGAWSSRGEMTLSLGSDPGWNSMTESGGSGREITVPVLPIDDIVAELGLSKVDFIKMDIEGAEKEALRGAVDVLKTHRPRVMIDTYQWAEDLEGLLGEVRRGGANYEPYCGPCEPSADGSSIVPHMTIYEPL
jgi:FkbM family methyltransferase